MKDAINKTNKGGAGLGGGQKSQEKIESIFTDMIFSGVENFNLTMNSSKTLEDAKNIQNKSTGGGLTEGDQGDNYNTTLSKTPSLSD